MRSEREIQTKIDQLVLLEAEARLAYIDTVDQDVFKAQGYLIASLRYRMIIDTLRWVMTKEGIDPAMKLTGLI